MSQRLRIASADLATLVSSARAAGTTVIAPSRTAEGALEYGRVDNLEQAELDGSLPRSPLKRYFLPPTEPLFSWSRDGRAVHVHEVATGVPKVMVLGARPCDAAALPIVDRVMSWDCVDQLWFGRRSATTVIAIACTTLDSSCFCTAVGVAPDASTGSDLLLTPVDDGYLVDVTSVAGKRLVQEQQHCFANASEAGNPAASRGGHRAVGDASMASVRSWLQDHFDDPMWRELALACHGCGVCAAVCPTCHCFDIVDEPDGVSSGTRRRNWDTCQSARFTVHASGHNPRADQAARLRQRLLHKFLYYPRRFDQILCTGCGRCARACPAGIDLPEILQLLRQRAAANEQEGPGA